MTSKYIRECRNLMKFRQHEIAEIYKYLGFPYCGKSKRRKLRMAARIVVYKHGPNHSKKVILKTIKFLINTGQV